MRLIILYSIYAIASLVMAFIAYLFAPIICLFIRDRKLPKWLAWFGTPDNPTTGDPSFWPQQHPTYSPYQLDVTWMWRNPAQGFDKYLEADVAYNTLIDVRGNLNISDSSKPPVGGWFLITGGGVFHFKAIIPTKFGCLVSYMGWRLEPIAKDLPSDTLGAFMFTPLRLFKAK